MKRRICGLILGAVVLARKDEPLHNTELLKAGLVKEDK